MEEIKCTDEKTIDGVLNVEEMTDKIDSLSVVSDNLNEQKDIMYSYVDCDDTSFIDEKLSKYTLEELEERVKDDDFVRRFFIKDDIEVPINESANNNEPFTDDTELEFKRELLIHAKKTNQTYAEIDQYISGMEKAREDFNKEASSIVNAMEGNIVSLVDTMKEDLNDITDERELKRKKTIIKYIESGWSLEIINDVLDKHPNVPKNIIRDMNNDTILKQISAKYKMKLFRNNSVIDLTHFVSMPTINRKSIEMTLLNPDQYNSEHEDLFIFTLIRFFAMADWNNKDIKRAHTSIAVSIKRVMSNEYDEDMKNLVINNIANLISRIEDLAKK